MRYCNCEQHRRKVKAKTLAPFFKGCKLYLVKVGLSKTILVSATTDGRALVNAIEEARKKGLEPRTAEVLHMIDPDDANLGAIRLLEEKSR